MSLTFGVFAQNVSDALRYSYFEYGGTARFVGSGGAMGPLGGDLSLSGTNPAGLAWIHQSEYSITPSILASTASSQLRDAVNSPLLEDERGVFNLHNFAVVFTSKPRLEQWKNVNFGIAFNHLANFNREFSFQGVSEGSLIQRFQERANTIGLDDYEASLAEQASAIYDIDNDGRYDIDYEIPTTAPSLFKSQNGVTKGSMSEMTFSFAGNYDDKVLIGLTIGVPFFSYTLDKTYTERDDPKIPNGGAIPYFRDLEYVENVTTLGGGVNAKLGIILRPHQAFRLGMAVHTPTVLSLSDDYESTLTYNYFEDSKEQGQFLGKTAESPGNFDYGLKTPWRLFGGVGLLFGNHGFFSGEVEYVDFGKSRFRYDGFESEEIRINGAIRDQLQNTLNIRLGGEFAYDIFRLRAGINVLPSPYADDETTRYAYSGGLGLRMSKFYLDMAYRRSKQTELYYPYVTEEAPIQEVENKFFNDAIVMTLGFKF